MAKSRMSTRPRPLSVSVRSPKKGDLNKSGSTRDEIAWLCLPGIYLAGLAAHGTLEKYGSTSEWVLTVVCILAATSLVAWRIWVLMGPRRKVERENVTGVFAAAGVGAALSVLLADEIAWAIVYLISGVAAAVIFNAQESKRVKGTGEDTHVVKGVDPEALGLAAGTTVRPAGKDSQEVVIDHKDGQTVSDVRSQLERWESLFKLRPGTLIARIGKHRGQTIIRPVDTTRLDATMPFEPPAPPVGFSGALSIADPIRVGTYADGTPAETVFAGHELVMGTTGSGKSIRDLVKATRMMTRRDVCVLWCDPIAGPQSAAPIIDGVAWPAVDDKDAKAMVAGILRAVPARIADLASHRMTKWEPRAFTRHGIPKVFVQFEEAAWLVDNGALVKIAEQARKAGIEFCMSLQRASHGRMDTDVRANLIRRTCFWVLDIADAGFCLPDHVIDAGARPDAWMGKPGMHIMSAPDVPESRWAMPIRGDLPTRDGDTEDLTVLTEVVRAHAHVRAQLDPVMVTALGPAYQNWLGRRDQVLADMASGDDDQMDMPTATAPVTSRRDQVTVSTVTTDQSGHDQDSDDLDMAGDDMEDLPMPMLDGIDLTGVDPDRDDQDTSADDVDLGDLTASRLSTAERNERFRRMLIERHDGGQSSVSQTELSTVWHSIPGGGGRPWPYMRLARLADLGLMAQDEQDPVWWHFVSAPATWDAGATTGGDDSGDALAG
jgi:hypothetical protein